MKESIKSCREAGVNVFMITGDVKETAESIALQIGILQPNFKEQSFTSKEFLAFDDKKQNAILSSGNGLVFSRTEPAHKRYLVKKLSELVYLIRLALI